MKRLAGMLLLLTLLPASAASAESWSLRGTDKQLKKAASTLSAEGVRIEKRRHRLMAHGASRAQLAPLGVQAWRSVKVKMAQDPVIPDSQWQAWSGLMGTDEAWQSGQGQGALVAVLDTGVTLTHPDLRDNIWSNPGEVPDNGIDDDGNGYVDDVNGVSILKPLPPMDKNGHGTHVAGIIAASLNDFGTNGVAPQARIMPIEALDSKGEGNSADVNEGIRYAVANGAQIINISVTMPKGVPPESQIAIDEAERAGVLVVGAAGNEGQNLDGRSHFPASLDNDNVISVGWITDGGRKAPESNYGKDSVDLASFGQEIPSTWLGNKYALMSGTSMAAPMVSGSAAILAGLYPGRGAIEWKQALTQSVVRLDGLSKYFRYGGVVNLPSALAWQAEQSGEPLASSAARFRGVYFQARKKGSRRNLTVGWQLAGGGAGEVASVRVSAQGKSRTTAGSSATLTRLRKGTVTVRLSARDQSGKARGKSSFRLRIR